MSENARAALTRESLADLLEASGVRPEAYALYGAHTPDAIVMDHRVEGWVVFYTERGEESSVRHWSSEAEACQDLLDRVTADEHNFYALVAGPAPASDAGAQFESWLADHGIALSDLGEGEWKVEDIPWAAGEPYFVGTSPGER